MLPSDLAEAMRGVRGAGDTGAPESLSSFLSWRRQTSVISPDKHSLHCDSARDCDWAEIGVQRLKTGDEWIVDTQVTGGRNISGRGNSLCAGPLWWDGYNGSSQGQHEVQEKMVT